MKKRKNFPFFHLRKDFGEKLMDDWDVILKGVERTVDFLEQERVFDSHRLPTDIVIPMLVGLWGLAPDGLDEEGQARVILRRFLWRAFFTDRYERATNSRTVADFKELRKMVTNGGTANPDVFDEKEFPLPAPEGLISGGWPIRKDRIPRAILALALKKGGIDLADGSPATRENLKKREYHHLFPVARLKEKGVEDNEIFKSLNCALVTWRTNRTIAAKEPEKYLAERRDGND
ncbi:MAG: hypothetical protein IIC64_09980 [SAR324 cluster bacterium]|nr:hypothetical protein [SAR324 cluster bacterium]